MNLHLDDSRGRKIDTSLKQTQRPHGPGHLVLSVHNGREDMQSSKTIFTVQPPSPRKLGSTSQVRKTESGHIPRVCCEVSGQSEATKCKDTYFKDCPVLK